MRIVWTEKSENQLSRIFDYIADDSILYAHRTVGQIIEQVEGIFPNPLKGRMVPEYEDDHIREVFHHPYRIIYLIKDNIIVILSVTRLAYFLMSQPDSDFI